MPSRSIAIWWNAGDGLADVDHTSRSDDCTRSRRSSEQDDKTRDMVPYERMWGRIELDKSAWQPVLHVRDSSVGVETDTVV